MEAIGRKEMLLQGILEGDSSTNIEPGDREEALLKGILEGESSTTIEPGSTREFLLKGILEGETSTNIEPKNNKEILLKAWLEGEEETNIEPADDYERLLTSIVPEKSVPYDVPDSVPYVFRHTGGGVSVGDRVKEKIVGGSIVWNQLVDTNTADVTIPSGNKYIAYINDTWSVGQSAGAAISVTGGTDMVCNLTQMFGTTIADYIYSLETATAGAGVAWFRNLFPMPYYSYNEGEIMSVKAASHDTVGFNQWDEEWEAGSIASATGANANDQTRVRAKNNIPVLPNTTYYFKASAGALALFYYDSNGEYIGFRSAQRNNTFTTIENAAYIRFTLGGSTNPVTSIDKGTVCVNLSWSGYRDGEYEEYKKRTYPLDTSLELRGVPKLDTSNKLYYDGDVYESDGTVTRKYGVVDMGSLNWNYGAVQGINYFYVNIAGQRNGKYRGQCVSPLYNCITTTPYSSAEDKTLFIGNSAATPVLYVRDDDYSDKNVYKAAMSGVYLVYELAEPTTETAEPYASPMIVDPDGTEEWVDIRDVPIPVGHDSLYRHPRGE